MVAFEVTKIFLDASEAFEKVWHDGLLFKLNRNDIFKSLLKLLSDFLFVWKQGVVLTGQHQS